MNSLACLALLIWGRLGQQIIQLCLPDDADKYIPRQCPQIKITPAPSQVCAGKDRKPEASSCLPPPRPPARPWWLRLCRRRRKCHPGDKGCSACGQQTGLARPPSLCHQLCLPRRHGRVQGARRELDEPHGEDGFMRDALLLPAGAARRSHLGPSCLPGERLAVCLRTAHHPEMP